MPQRLPTFLFMLSTLPALASSAFAAPITTASSQNFFLSDALSTTGADTVTLPLEMFDEALGILTNARITIDGLASLAAEIHSVGAPCSLGATLHTSVAFLQAPPLTLDTVDLSVNSGSCPQSFTDDQALTISLAYDQSIVAPFIGNGTLPLTLGALVDGVAQNAEVTGFWNGVVSVTYTYEPGPPPHDVPEPASVLMFAGGFAVWAATMRA